MTAAVCAEVIATSEVKLIVGLGVTGLSCARFLRAQGIAFTVADSRVNPPGLTAFRAEFPDVHCTLGELPAALLCAASELIVSPGVALAEPAVSEAIDAGVPVCGDIDLFCRATDKPVVGITGSNAKSTVTTLLGRMVARAGIRVAVGGNLGTPALDLLAQDADVYVLELSSFQLERAGQLSLAVACVLNVSSDHLDRHGDMQHYHQAKHRVFQGCPRIIVNRDDPLSAPLQVEGVELWSFGLQAPDFHGFGVTRVDAEEWLCYQFQPLLPCAELAMLGRHNIANALAALALGAALDLPMEAMLDELREFSGLPHRCQRIAVVAGVSFVNDSKATNMGAARAALEGLGGTRNVIMIAGGQAKGAHFEALRPVLQHSAKALLLLGEAAAQLEREVGDVVPCYRVTSMAAAVSLAWELSTAGDLVLLSPACASFDMYSGFAARGQAFVEAVSQLRSQEGRV